MALNHAHVQCANVVPPCFNSQGEEIPPCGSLNTQAGFHEITCLDCGRLTDMRDGRLVPLAEQFSPCGL
jgi:hypothetical protein